MTLKGWLRRADELCRQGRYFEAHEELEAGWLKASGAEKTVLQGVIQVCAGLHRLKTQPEKPAGAFYLFERGLEKLDKGKALLDEGGVVRLGEALRTTLTAGRAPEIFSLNLVR